MNKTREEEINKFLSKITKTQGCWLWNGPFVRKYGLFTYKYTKIRAHRYSYEYFNKRKIKEGFVIDHICKNPPCVNPKHLREVTITQNTLENSDSITAHNKKKTHCKRGHEFTKENTYHNNTRPAFRLCQKCIVFYRKDRDIGNKAKFREKVGEEVFENLYPKAKAVVIENGFGSATLLQSKLKMGFVRASVLIDMLEERGVLSKVKGKARRPRILLAKREKGE